MKALIEAVAASIQAEVAGAGAWKLQKSDPLWRNPKGGKMLNIWPLPARQGRPRWTKHDNDIVQIVVEYAEPSKQDPNQLKRVEAAELAAEDIADSIRNWALAHTAGFAPAWKMEWVRTDYTPNVRREFFVRYCRVILSFEVVKAHV